jgi:uncharacterized protein (DUF885 family)
MRIDRRSLIAGGALLAIGAMPSHDQEARDLLDQAASLSPRPRLEALRKIDRSGLSAGRRLDLAAALRAAALETGIMAAADPATRYSLQLRLHAGWDIAPAAAHALALDRAQRLTARADRLLRSEGLPSGSVAERLRILARDPRYLYPDDDAGRTQAATDMNRWLAAAKARLPEQFAILPPGTDRVAVVRMTPAEEEAGKAGYRTLPSADGASPGAYHVDLHAIRRRPDWSLPSVVHHETLPGHMIQLPLQAAADPHPLRLRAAPGFVEGWAIYAEQLTAESGAYAADPRAEIGYIQWMLFRLGRSLIDTGMNHLGWSRDQAQDFLRDLQGDPVIFAPFEKDIERAATVPGDLAGQALTWLGLIRLRGARRPTPESLRRFHDRLLRFGAAPLALYFR